MASNHVLLQSITLTSSAASITFNNLPTSGYTDLKIVISSRLDFNAAIASLGVHLNNPALDTSYRWIRGSGAAAASGSDSSQQDFYIGEAPALTATANVFSNAEVYIPEYRGSQQKQMTADCTGEQNGATAYQYFSSGLSTKTAAITSVTIRGFAGSSGNLVSGSTFSIYGIAAFGTTPTIAPFATGGDNITTDGTFWYHTFLSSAIFRPNRSLVCGYLVVAGGGSGFGGYLGGGGAGGLRSTVTATGGGGTLESNLSLIAQNYPVVIGAGGTLGLKGSNSVFSTVTSLGGGGANPGTERNGGSGGGGGAQTISPTAGTGTAGQGRNGGDGNVTNGASAGGGGAGTAGSAGSGTLGGAGGNGVQITALANPTLTGFNSGFYAGGGAGGSDSGGPAAGGLGGGGTGGRTGGLAAGSGLANSGGGGGATYTGNGYGNGGSGIVIIRYPV